MPDSSVAWTSSSALIVDDDEDVRELLAEHLRGRGFEVATARDGGAALAALARAPGPLRLVLADLHLPGADGLAVAEAARAQHPSAYVVIITGYATIDTAIHAVRIGASDYLTKPFSLGQIDVILQRVAERSALEAEVARVSERLRAQEGGDGGLHVRLTAIERRLQSIESLLRERDSP